MKIYGICVGDVYEGGITQNPLFKLKSDAIMEANALANKHNTEMGMEYELHSDEIWRDGSEYIKVIDYDLF